MRRVTVGRVAGTTACLVLLFLNYRLDYSRGSQAITIDDLAGSGPGVGEPFPDFEIEEIGGGSITLGELRGQPAVIVFGRSLDWCPFTKSFVSELAASLGKHPRANVVLVFSPNQVNLKAVRFLFDRRIHFRVGSDRGRQLIDGLGLTNTSLRNKIEAGVPYPATFVLDAKGIVRLRDTRRDHRFWLAGDVVRRALDSLI